MNGSTFDDWEEAELDPGTSVSCSKYCLESYVGDGVCDMVCMTAACDFDGGDCYCKIYKCLLCVVIRFIGSAV